MRINHRSIGKYSGPVIYGTETASVPKGSTAEYHAERAYWLTGQVETGNKMGSVMMADGTAFTIGRDQHIAVYPRELSDEDFNAQDDQGGAWELLAAIEASHAGKQLETLWEAFKQRGWYVSPEGSLRWLDDGPHKVKGRNMEHKAGDLVHGAVIRNFITPTNGKVTKTCEKEQAREWAIMLHELTADKRTWDTQKAFGLKHLIDRVQTTKIKVKDHRRRATVQQAVYGNRSIAVLKSDELSPQLDLAMCVLHSYTVNAPSVALKVLSKSIDATAWMPAHDLTVTSREVTFANDLLFRLKQKKYGRWEKRWARTRKEAMAVGWWDKSLFQRDTAVMGP